MEGFDSGFNYGEITSCKTEAELNVMLERLTIGFSGIPSASLYFNYTLNQKEALGWLIQTSKNMGCDRITVKAEEFRKNAVQTLKSLLE